MDRNVVSFITEYELLINSIQSQLDRRILHSDFKEGKINQ